ncbi:hypothetical protein HNQ07_001021 [Deinococcus metalli]|uniref:Lipoprotein n=1 Tax=Deinococcus metalli TaxID=1141878 RepID=A0A7W8NQY5_9DEIO|nr:hypothetical protein [Deinococcus metalli]MBB5375577.1 hypothetical protein [Deinococcus metalli]GHF28232.1 hypothetical protein GCM10017781_00180 [Deinococcus metalli]
MKKLLALPMLALLIAACGTAPGQVSGNSRASVGVSVDDSKATAVAKKTVTPATTTTPEKISWTITPGGGVTFTFMTRPGSDAVYLTGYRVVKDVLTTAGGTTTTTTNAQVNKADLYLTSGFTCTARTTLNSCPFNATDAVPSNGIPGQLAIGLDGGLGDLVVATDASVSRVTDLEFYGTSSNGQPVTVAVSGVVSTGSKQGDN